MADLRGRPGGLRQSRRAGEFTIQINRRHQIRTVFNDIVYQQPLFCGIEAVAPTGTMPDAPPSSSNQLAKTTNRDPGRDRGAGPEKSCSLESLTCHHPTPRCCPGRCGRYVHWRRHGAGWRGVGHGRGNGIVAASNTRRTGPRRRLAPNLRRKNEIHPRVTKKVAGPPEKANNRCRMKLGSSVGRNLLPPSIRNPVNKETNTE